MRKAGAFLLILLFGFTLLFAQEEDKPSDGDGDWDFYSSDYTQGDQTFTISLGTVFPTVFVNNGKTTKHNFDPPVGGTGSLSYNFFFNSNIFLGGEVGGSFVPTLGENMYYYILLGARTGYQFYFWRLEFPVNLSVGMVWHRYLTLTNYSLYLKSGGAVYFRYNTEWSFGLLANWNWFPQWTDDPAKTVHGNMIDLLVSVRYHF